MRFFNKKISKIALLLKKELYFNFQAIYIKREKLFIF